jgi:hypothetical protein
MVTGSKVSYCRGRFTGVDWVASHKKKQKKPNILKSTP